MKTHKHNCGCVSEVGDRERWVSLCELHEAEYQEVHQRWAEEHRDGIKPPAPKRRGLLRNEP
jgi:hypothetical protein